MGQNLKIRGRFAIVFCTFLLPIAYLLYSIIAEKNIAIDFAQKERDGAAYVSALRDSHINLWKMVRRNGDAFVLKLEDVAQAEKKFGPEMDSQELFKAFSDKAQTLQGLSSNNATALLKEGWETAKALRALMVRIGDQSNLILDPDLDSFYVMDAVVVKLPDLTDRLAALTDAAIALRNNPAPDLLQKAEFFQINGNFETAVESLNSSIESAYRGNADGTVKKSLDQPLRAALDTLERLKSEFRKSVESAEKNLSPTQILALEDQALQNINEVWRSGENELIRLLTVRIDGFHQKLWTTLAITFVLFTAIFVFGGLTVTRQVISPIERMTTVLEALAAGNWTIAIPDADRKDEIGQMAKAGEIFKLNAAERAHMMELQAKETSIKEDRQKKIEKLTGDFSSKILKLFNTVSQSVKEVAGAADKLNEGISETFKKSSVALNAATQANGNADTVSTASEALADSINRIGHEVTKAAKVAANAVEQANATTQRIRRLDDTVTEIGEVVKLISGIAGQTNLLALNASIEAARAGESGKGFTVVANEVKGLASQTARATEGVSKRIHRIQEETAAAVEAIATITRTIDAISEIAVSIAEAMSRQRATTHSIAGHAHEATESTQIVTQRIGEVTTVTQEAVITVERVSNAANLVYTETEQTHNSINLFIKQMHLCLSDHHADSHVPALEWREDLTVHNRDLDNDHKKLFALFNELSAAMRTGQVKSIVMQTFDALIDYTVVHFEREEHALASVKYQGLTAQQESHQMFVRKIKDIRARYMATENNSLVIETMDFIKGWLIDHIQVADRAYAPFITKAAVF